MKEVLNRFRSKVVIASMLSLIFIILTNLGLINIGDETIQSIINAILTILAGFGILNNPTDRDNF